MKLALTHPDLKHIKCGDEFVFKKQSGVLKLSDYTGTFLFFDLEDRSHNMLVVYGFGEGPTNCEAISSHCLHFWLPDVVAPDYEKIKALLIHYHGCKFSWENASRLLKNYKTLEQIIIQLKDELNY